MAKIKVTSTRAFDSANELNAQARKTLGLGEHNAMKVAGMRFSREVDDFSFEIVRLHDGKFIMRLLAKESTSGKQLKGHLELNLADEAELIDLLNKDQFWSGDYMRKLSQFVGYVGEAHVMRKLAGNPPKMTAYKPTRGNKAAEAIEYEFKPGTIMSLQKPGGEQGLDILGYKEKPPPPGWLVADVKATARSAQDLAGFKTPKTPGKSDLQKVGADYALKRINDALDSVKNGTNIYELDAASIANLRSLSRSIRLKQPIEGVVFRVGMKEGFELAGNSKYPEMILAEAWF